MLKTHVEIPFAEALVSVTPSHHDQKGETVMMKKFMALAMAGMMALSLAACGGSYMVTADLIDNQKWDEIIDLCKQSVAIVKEARNG